MANTFNNTIRQALELMKQPLELQLFEDTQDLNVKLNKVSSKQPSLCSLFRQSYNFRLTPTRKAYHQFNNPVLLIFIKPSADDDNTIETAFDTLEETVFAFADALIQTTAWKKHIENRQQEFNITPIDRDWETLDC